VGVAGELVVGGAGVARGYHGRPRLTAERFVPDPARPGGRRYRSGDLARWLPGGELDYHGRADQQVKVRGFRIEPGEIEAALLGHPAVRAAVVVAAADGDGERRLVAYLVAAPGAELPAVGELRAWLGERLPEYMVPGAFVGLPALPLTANGKVDRRALPAAGGAGLAAAVAYAAPRTPTEEALAGLWREVLKVERVGVDDDLFDLGAHSLLAVRLIARIRDTFGVELPLRSLYEAPTVARLAVLVVQLRAERAEGAEGLESLLAEVEGLSEDELARLLATEGGEAPEELPR
jgi:acyl carrier protein